MMFKTHELSITTTAGGAGTATTGVINGKLYAVQWIDGTFDDGVDGTFTVTSTDAAVDYTILTLTNANNDAFYVPRVQLNDLSGAAVVDGASAGIYDAEMPIVGKIKLVIAQGGASKTGGAVIFIEE